MAALEVSVLDLTRLVVGRLHKRLPIQTVVGIVQSNALTILLTPDHARSNIFHIHILHFCRNLIVGKHFVEVFVVH